jgi:hypothetical protein
VPETGTVKVCTPDVSL